MHERNQVWNKYEKTNKIQSQVQIIIVSKKIDKHTKKKIVVRVLLCAPMLALTTIVATKHTQHNMKIP
jgi:hypothetical protein